MSSSSPIASDSESDNCSICLNILTIGTSLLTLSCGHKYHLQCLITNAKAQNKECPLCRTPIDSSLLNMLAGHNRPSSIQISPSLPIVVESVEERIDENAVNELTARVRSAQEAAVSSYSTSDVPSITLTTTLEYGAQPSNQQSNIYGLVTLKAPPSILATDSESLSSSRIPIDLVCVVDQSGSMAGNKMNLLKETLIYITEQLNEFDRLAIVSFDTRAYDRSHGLKCMNLQNRHILKRAIERDIHDAGGTFIGSGLEMGIQLLTTRQTKNPLGGLLLLTDGQDNDTHDYTQLMCTLPDGIQCHTFGYGIDHTPSLLVQIAEQGHQGTFTYIDEQQAVGPAFAIALGGLFTCIAQQLRVCIQLDGQYQITNIHSKYPYEPKELPSSEIIFQLNDLNADENRNLVFQLNTPKLEDEENVQMNSLQSMSQDQQIILNNHTIGHVSLTYIEPTSNRTLTIPSVPFDLVRMINPPENLLQINYNLDLQRNRVETAQVLRLAMEEYDYKKSLALLKAQVEKIRSSVSSQDSFCQNLIKDLEHHYPSEQEYRSSHHNTSRTHHTERGTYFPSTTLTTQRYQNCQQMRQAAHYSSTHN